MSTRLTKNNLQEYLAKTYGSQSIVLTNGYRFHMKPLLQKNYGEPLDCTLTSITAVTNLLTGMDIGEQVIYDFVEATAEKYFYDGTKHGTLPVFIKNIFDATLVHFSIFSPTKAGYLKHIGYNWNEIKQQILCGNPVILSLYRDGRGYYQDHTITIIGFEEYMVGNKSVKMLVVYDNWALTPSYVDFNRLNLISSINYA